MRGWEKWVCRHGLNPKSWYAHDWIRCKSLLRLGSENLQFTKGVNKQAERDGQDHKVGVQMLCVPITKTGITKHIVKRSFEPSCYHRGLIVGVRTSFLKQKAGEADELQVCNRWEWTRKQPWKTLGRTPNVVLLLNSTTEGRHFLQSRGRRFNSQTFDLSTALHQTGKQWAVDEYNDL